MTEVIEYEGTLRETQRQRLVAAQDPGRTRSSGVGEKSLLLSITVLSFDGGGHLSNMVVVGWGPSPVREEKARCVKRPRLRRDHRTTWRPRGVSTARVLFAASEALLPSLLPLPVPASQDSL